MDRDLRRWLWQLDSIAAGIIVPFTSPQYLKPALGASAIGEQSTGTQIEASTYAVANAIDVFRGKQPFQSGGQDGVAAVYSYGKQQEAC